MANQNYDNSFDYDEFDEDETGSNGNVLADLRKALKAANKRNRELESKVAEFSTVQRETAIKNILESKNLNAKVAKLIPSDVAASEDSISQWLEDFGDVFGIVQTEVQETAPAAEQPRDLGALRQIDAVTSGAITPDKVQNLMTQLDQASSAEDILRLIYRTD